MLPSVGGRHVIGSVVPYMSIIMHAQRWRCFHGHDFTAELLRTELSDMFVCIRVCVRGTADGTLEGPVCPSGGACYWMNSAAYCSVVSKLT
jgi:hypothetical protein